MGKARDRARRARKLAKRLSFQYIAPITEAEIMEQIMSKTFRWLVAETKKNLYDKPTNVIRQPNFDNKVVR